MKNRILALICAFAFAFGICAPAFAGAGIQTIGTYDYIRETTYGSLRIGLGTLTATVLGATEPVTDLVIPAEVENYPVTAIVDNAFANDTTLKTADLGSVTNVGQNAFYNCTSLETVTASEMTIAGEGAFCGCSALTTVDFPELTIINDDAFSGCSSLTEIIVPEVVTIGTSAFSGCESLKKAKIPQIESVDGTAFAGCISLTSFIVDSSNTDFVSDGAILCDGEDTIIISYPSASGNVTLKDEYTEIADNAFSGAKNLVTVKGDEILSIGEAAFRQCENLTEIDFENVVDISGFAFEDDRNLSEANFPMLETIGYKTFSNTGFEQIEIYVSSMSSYAFSDCRKLQRVVTDFVTEIDDYAFNNCPKLREVYFWDAAPTISDEAFSGCSADLTFYYYQSSQGWSTPEWNGYPAYPFNTIPPFTPISSDSHTVTFKDGLTGATISTATVEHGADAVFPTAPTHEGYTFTGWSSDGKNITEDTTITAVYTEISIVTHTVTFMDGVTGLAFDTATVEHGGDAVFPTAPTHEGYTFTAWSSDGKNITADTTITAQYAINTYTVTFKDGLTGATISTATVEHGADAVFPTAPTHEGYTFMGWDKDGKNVTADMTVTALYEVIPVETHTVTFKDGLTGDIIATATVEHGEDVSFPEAPAHNNYLFTGWDSDGKNITADITITAQYVYNKHTIMFFDSVTNEFFSVITINHGEAVTFPEPPVHDGYTFTGWDNDGLNITQDTIITALYTINTYTVTFMDGVTGLAFDTATVEHGGDVTFPTAPTHEGYTFTAWSSDGKNITDDTTITAQYAINTYTVTFMDDVTGLAFGTATVEYGGDVTFPTAPTHEGYTFTNWDSDGKNITADTTITAQYDKITYTVTFVDGVTGLEFGTATVEHGDDVTFPEAPEHEGYTFTNWDSDGKNITADTTITAQYDIIISAVDIFGVFTDPIEDCICSVWSCYSIDENAPYEVTSSVWYDCDNDRMMNPDDTFVKGVQYQHLFTIAAKEGYVFSAETVMTINGDSSIVDASSHMENEKQLILNAKPVTATEKPYPVHTVTFVDGYSHEIIEEQQCREGSDAVFPTAPTHEGYTFSRWDNDGKNITADITITALYDINVYTVTLKDGYNNNTIKTVYVEHGKNVAFPNAPVHEGYTFTGWDNDGKNITSDKTITALYKINTYTVKFVDGLTGETITTVTVEHGKDVQMPAAPEHEGYEFTGWDKNGKNIKADTTITAQYKEIENPVLIGDVNGDGKINTSDAVQILKYAAGMVQLDENQQAAADINHDGKVNTADAVLILKYAAGMITEF